MLQRASLSFGAVIPITFKRARTLVTRTSRCEIVSVVGSIDSSPHASSNARRMMSMLCVVACKIWAPGVSVAVQQ
ncbi:MAG TPA: hypothetical protein EYP98_19100 [Planctomycetes bacterium]|nr:hypothetical protein [Planctomycetota bacterium]